MMRPHLLYAGDLLSSVTEGGPTFTNFDLDLILIDDWDEGEKEKNKSNSEFKVLVNPGLICCKSYGMKGTSDGRRFFLGGNMSSGYVLLEDELKDLDNLVAQYFGQFKDEGWDIRPVPQRIDKPQLMKKSKELADNILIAERNHRIYGKSLDEASSLKAQLAELHKMFKEGRYSVDLFVNCDDSGALNLMSGTDRKSTLLDRIPFFGAGKSEASTCNAWRIEDKEYILERFMQLANVFARSVDFYLKIKENKDLTQDMFLGVRYENPIALKRPFREFLVGGVSKVIFDFKEEDNLPKYDTMADYRRSAQGVVVAVRPKAKPITIGPPPPKQASTQGKNETEAPLHEKLNISAGKIFEALGEYVVGQEGAKRTLAAAAYKHYARIYQAESDVEIEKNNILLYGPSGSGKTYLMESLARILDVPIVIVDATSFTAPGYHGADADTMIESLVANANKDLQRAQMGIIYIDEIDKLSSAGDNATIKTTQVQHNLLKLIEGKVVKTSYGPVNTKQILFVCGGAFAGDPKSGNASLEDAVKERLGVNERRRIGFNSEGSAAPNVDYHKMLDYVSTDDLHSYGLTRELIGRLQTRVGLNKLTKDELLKIITDPVNAPLKQTQKLFAQDGVNLQFEPAALEYIAEMAYSGNTGAREIRSYLGKIETEYLSVIGTGKKTVTITRDDVTRCLS